MVDPKPGTAFNPQANATQARTMEHYRRLGLAAEIRALGLPADHPTDIAYFTRYAHHELARLQLPTAAQAVKAIRTMGGSWSAAELPHRISQKYVEATLLRHARELPGADLRYGWRMESFEDDGDGIRAMIRPVDGDSLTPVRAHFLIGADGARSGVRHALGFAWSGATGIRRNYMGGKMFAVYLRAPTFYEVMPHARAWMYVSVNHERRALIASVDGRSEFAFHASVHEGEEADTWTEADARRIFAEAMGVEIPIEVLSVATWTAGHSLVAEHMQRGRVFIGGDAAHLFTPTGGLGYNTAVEDAVNLGWKLAAVLQGQAPLSLLDSYEVERKPLAERNTGYARRFADSVGLFPATPQLEEDSAQGEAERQAASAHLKAHVRMEFNIPGVTFGGRYDHSPIIVDDGTLAPADDANVYQPTAKPGGRPPHAWLPDGRSLFDTFGFGWTLLLLGPEPPEPLAFVEAAQSLRLDVAVVRHADASLLALYEAPLALIRPDQVVAWRGSSTHRAEEVLRQVLGHQSPASA